jgi:hypothetical protein
LILAYHAITELPAFELFHNRSIIPEASAHERTVIQQASIFLYLFLPATLARFEAVKYINEWEKLIMQSKYMADLFEKMIRDTDRVTNENELSKVLILLNENMYWENMDWEMFMTDKNEKII